MVSVTFTPSAAGVRSGHITISDTDPSNLQTVALSGQAQVPTSTVTLHPVSASVTFTQTQQYTASINGSDSTDVTSTAPTPTNPKPHKRLDHKTGPPHESPGAGAALAQPLRTTLLGID